MTGLEATLATPPDLRDLVEAVRGLAALQAAADSARNLLESRIPDVADDPQGFRDGQKALTALDEVWGLVDDAASALDRLDLAHAGLGGFAR